MPNSRIRLVAAAAVSAWMCFVAGGGDAPPRPVHDGDAFWIKVVGQADGSLTVTNTRNGFSKTYR